MIAGPDGVADYETFDGQRLAYRHWATPGSPYPPLVYVHGIESHSGWFHRAAGELAALGVEVYAVDRRGSGQNWLGRGHCRAYEHLLVDLVVFLRDVVGAPRVHLLGLSWGAKLAFVFARDYPERLASLILLTPGIWPRVGLAPAERRRVAWRWLRNRQTRMRVPLRPDLFSEMPMVRHAIDVDPQRLTAVTPAFYWETRRLDRLVQPASRCPVPLYAVLSRHDRIVDTPHTERWLAQLTAPRKRTTILDAGHAIQLERPASLAADLHRWIADAPT